jgi:hypothetical protein
MEKGDKSTMEEIHAKQTTQLVRSVRDAAMDVIAERNAQARSLGKQLVRTDSYVLAQCHGTPRSVLSPMAIQDTVWTQFRLHIDRALRSSSDDPAAARFLAELQKDESATAEVLASIEQETARSIMDLMKND